MRWFPRTARSSQPVAEPGPERELFDEAFQKRLEGLALMSRRLQSAGLRAERPSKKAGSGVEFADYREYSAGDDLRHVDWNAYARSERLLLRLHEEEEDLCVYLLVDSSASMGLGSPSKLDYAKQLTAALAYVSLSHLDRVALLALADGVVSSLPAMRGKQRIFSVFAFLRPLTAQGRTDLAAAATNFVAAHKRRGVVVLVSDLYDFAGWQTAISTLRYAKFEPYVLQLVDASDEDPGLGGDIELIDAETGEARALTVTPALLQRVRAARQRHERAVAAFCAQKQVPYFALDTRVTPQDAVLRILRRGGMLG